MRAVLFLLAAFSAGCSVVSTNDDGGADAATDAGNLPGRCPPLPGQLLCGPNDERCAAPFWVRNADGIAPCTVIDCTGKARGQWPREACR